MKKFIGTSGYNYSHWEGVFYPKEWPKNKLLEYYSQFFNSVELNVTFYRLPNQSVFKNWQRKTPSEFKFVIKGSRFITHVKRLKEVKNSLEMFFENASYLGEKLICVLWQLPASFKFNLERLKGFIAELKNNKLAKRVLHSFEFRDKSWFNQKTFKVLREENINLCIADSPRWPSQEVLTSNFLYLRFHGGKILYGSEYSEEELKKWTEKTKKWLKEVDTLFVFFNNDAYGFAIKNAKRFKELLNEV